MDIILNFLLLVIVANGAPVFMQYIFAGWCAWPVDAGKKLWDGQPVFGHSKTWRGLLFALITTPVFAIFLDYSLMTGLLLAVYSMTGDLFSSFMKRRMHRAPSSMVLFLDQVPEVLFPALLLKSVFEFTLWDIVLVCAIFIITELLLSQVLYKWGIRRRPY